MAVWVLQRALETLDILPPHYRQELADELAIHGEELDRWHEISRKMRVVFHAGGVLTQFEGHEDLREFDWEGYRDKYGDIQRLDRVLEAEGDSTGRYKVSKQADVLMLLFLLSRRELRELLGGLGYEVSDEQLARTVRYYLDRTPHGSTLSSVVSAWVLARYQPEEAWRFLQRALDSDVADVQGRHHRRGHPPRGHGRHGRPRAAVPDWPAGSRPVVRFEPALPSQVKSLRFRIHYRGHRLDVAFAEGHVTIGSRPGVAGPITVLVRDESVELRPGGQHEFSLNPEA
jgi:alpha,alpha-trehalase